MPVAKYSGSILILLVLVSTAWPKDPPRDLSESAIKALVERLVSPNPKPITGKEDKSVAPDYLLPPGFDRAKQKPVLQARQDLAQVGTSAFPYLLERWDDDRHCMTMFHSLSEYSENVTVGFVCRNPFHPGS